MLEKVLVDLPGFQLERKRWFDPNFFSKNSAILGIWTSLTL